MLMLRILIIITLIIIAIPFLQKAGDYIKEKSSTARDTSETIEKAIKDVVK